MKLLKNIALYLLLLMAMAICGIIVLKIFDLILNLGFENVWASGSKVGFIAWIGMLINEYYHYIKDKKNKG